MKFKKSIIAILLLLVLINFLFSVQIFFKTNNSEDFCVVGEQCANVQTSKYAKTFGVENTVFGMAGFGLLTIFLFKILFTSKKNRIITFLSKIIYLASSFVALWFIYTMAFILHEWCYSCLWVDVTTILGTIVFLTMNKKEDDVKTP